MRYPVLRLSFGGGNFTEPGSLLTNLMAQLDAVESRSGVASACRTGPERLAALVEALHRKAGRPVAVLVDEYDKPILDALDTPDVARANRDFLRGVYGVVKDADAHIRFSFFTGVSKFSQASLFSGLNNLIDITLEPAFSAVCGYTDRDLDTVFAPELPGLDRDQIREWYNGYRWLGEEVYNPFDLLLLFRRRKFGAYWFETGTPTFLLETLLKRRVSSVELGGMVGDSELLSTFDVDDMSTEALLFQTGYLTITGEADLGGKPLYRLGYPNREVRQSLHESLLRYLVKDATRQVANSVRLYELLETGDFAGLEALFQAFFSSHPPTSGTRTTTSRTTRATTRACSTPTSPPWDWTSRWRTAPATAAWTWLCASRGTSTCSSSRWWSWNRRGAADGAAAGEGLRGQVPGRGTGRCSWLAWSSAGWSGTWWGLRWRGGEGALEPTRCSIPVRAGEAPLHGQRQGGPGLRPPVRAMPQWPTSWPSR